MCESNSPAQPQLQCSVVICTRNRSAQLKRVLQSMRVLVIPPGVDWEVIVVDNGSTDATADVLSSFAAVLPLRRVVEQRLGLSHARNAGVQAALGDYMIWTDDDVWVDRLWLAAYVENFRKWPDAIVFGGKVTPELLPPSPSWFRDAAVDLQALLAQRDFGPAERSLDLAAGEYPYGVNFAIRSDAQRACRYDPKLGVAPGRRMGGEEFDVMDRATASGESCRWVPSASVQHLIPPQRQTLRYVFTYYASEGEVWAANNPGITTILGLPLLTCYKMPVTAVRFLASVIVRSRSRTRHAKRLAWHHGVMRNSLVRRWSAN